jgi:pyrroloquinoline quinone (PQQ) biosynthesis protein C
MSLLSRLDDVGSRRNILRHPFYVRWERGELSPAELARYAGQYRHAVVALAEASRAAGDPEHAAEEAAHVTLWDAFAAALNAPATAATDETATCVRTWTAASDPLEAEAILYAIESAQPEVSRTKLEGIVPHFGFVPGSAASAYFEVHAERDAEHAARARRELEARATPADEDRLVAAADAALAGNWTLLDGVGG